MDPSTYLDHLRRDSARFRDVLSTCDPGARVPACPDWDASDLLWHLAEVQLFWATIVDQRPAGPPEQWPPPRPGTYDALLAAFDHHSAALVAALEASDPADEAWHWSPEQTVGVTFRRQAHEALIHRLDAEQTAGAVTGLDPALAADGLRELFDIMYGGAAPDWGRIEPGSRHVAFELTDLGETIWVQPCTFYGTDPDSGRNYDGPHLLHVHDPGTPADATVRGTAADLDAWLWKRRDDAGIEVTGDEAAYAAFRAAVDPPLT